MSDPDDIQAGLDQMNFEMVDNGVIEIPSSRPASFAFTTEPTLDVDAIEPAFAEYDFGTMDMTHDTRENGDFYCYFDVVTDHYKRLSVKIWREKCRIYPHENRVDTYELTRIVHAIEAALGAELEHSPEATP